LYFWRLPKTDEHLGGWLTDLNVPLFDCLGQLIIGSVRLHKYKADRFEVLISIRTIVNSINQPIVGNVQLLNQQIILEVV